MTLDRGALLYNRYRVIEILGEGGMGAVYKARDENLGVAVAVKENLFTTDEYARQFRTEARILAGLRHPNMPRVTDHFVVDEKGQYLVMDYIKGEDLRDRMDRLGKLDEKDVIVVGVAICEALSYLHSRMPPVLHRDVKPGNVKIAPDGGVYLVDFGLAKIMEGHEITMTGARAMTPGYSPPEQYGTARTDPRSDVYSLGATLYAALTNHLPEDGLARAMDQENLTPVRKHNRQVSRRLGKTIEKSLAVHPDDRYQSAEDFRKALLESNTATREKVNQDGLVVPPPPPEVIAGKASLKRERGGAKANSPILSESAGGEGSIRPDSFPIPISTVDDEPRTGAGSTKGRGWGCWLVGVALIVLITGLGAGAYYYPEYVAQAIVSMMPNSGTPTPTATQGATENSLTAEMLTNDEIVAIASETATTTNTSTLTPTNEATATPTPTATPTLTPSSTITPTPKPTPLGGGYSQIAFASNRTGEPQIWLINTDGTGLTQITDVSGGACQPTWSPDGSKIVFISPCPHEQEIYPDSGLFFMNPDGSEITGATNIRGGDYDPAWSPNGRFIAFTSERNLFTQVIRLDLNNGNLQVLADKGIKNFQPAWNAEGDRLAFVSAQQGPFQIWLMNPNGSNQESFSRSGGLKNTNPVWSPDDTLIAFSQRKLPDGYPRIVITTLENPFNEFYLIPDLIPNRNPDFSPDGKWLVFEGWPDLNHDIYIVSADGVNMVRLTDHESFDFDPAWRPRK